MTIPTPDYEKLGVFYMGRRLDANGEVLHEPVLYHSKDLTTHAVIIGMTGSGKTGLGIGMLEEAAIDRIPVIAIDPKGDLGNLLLNFPKMDKASLEPWVDPAAAATQGLSTADYAGKQAQLWRKGLKTWDQPLSRIKTLRDAAETSIYTPGSSAGTPVSVLKSFDAPAQALRDDGDAYAQRIQASVTGLLTLLGIDADPLGSREHILVSNILRHEWDAGRNLDIATLIGMIQAPPIERIGVMSMDSFFPGKDRFKLAMRINNLLASPGFAAWMEGVPLDARQLFYNEGGKPKLSVMSIAHLNDDERMFFVTMLLSEIINWMRAQPGTSSLRAILYMDEIFGYMPPTANPPSKELLLLLLKQARAFGLGIVLSTQNPVDLDYKGLSNTGTWFIGRLQTDRDKQRLIDGLMGAAAGEDPPDKRQLQQTLTGLGKRQFLLHNVHRGSPSVFETRWVLSYLAGPLTREQIKRLNVKQATAAPAPAAINRAKLAAANASRKPALDPAIAQWFASPSLSAPEVDSQLLYRPYWVGAADVLFTNASHKIDFNRQYLLGLEPMEGAAVTEWQNGQPLPFGLKALRKRGEKSAVFEPLPPSMENPKAYAKAEKLLKRWIRTEQALTLHRCTAMKCSSQPEESEGDFRIRLQTVANEQRDLAAAKLEKKYTIKLQRVEERLRKAQQRIEKEQAQASQRKLDTVVSVGSALIGALFGGRKSSTARRAGSAMRSAHRIRKESLDVDSARENAEALKLQLAELDREFRNAVDALDDRLDAQQEVLEPITVRARSSNIHVSLCGLLWLPHWQDTDGYVEPAWETA